MGFCVGLCWFAEITQCGAPDRKQHRHVFAILMVFMRHNIFLDILFGAGFVTHTHARARANTCTCTRAHTHACTRAHTQARARARAHAHARTHAHVRTRAHTHTQPIHTTFLAHTHTHTPAHMHYPFFNAQHCMSFSRMTNRHGAETQRYMLLLFYDYEHCH